MSSIFLVFSSCLYSFHILVLISHFPSLPFLSSYNEVNSFFTDLFFTSHRNPNFPAFPHLPLVCLISSYCIAFSALFPALPCLYSSPFLGRSLYSFFPFSSCILSLHYLFSSSSFSCCVLFPHILTFPLYYQCVISVLFPFSFVVYFTSIHRHSVFCVLSFTSLLFLIPFFMLRVNNAKCNNLIYSFAWSITTRFVIACNLIYLDYSIIFPPFRAFCKNSAH